jgi:hypothetical protein
LMMARDHRKPFSSLHQRQARGQAEESSRASPKKWNMN